MIKASSNTELIQQLLSTDIKVPPRHKGRKTEHAEIYCLYKMLSTLANENSINYPLQVLKTERPDFLFISNSVKTGIEHTEAVPSNKAKQDFMRAKMQKNEIHYMTKHHAKEETKTTQELKNEIEKNTMTGGWHGDSVEVNWTEAMSHFIETKENNALKDGYTLYDKNSLLIYDNWPTAALDIDVGINYLKNALANSTHRFNFDTIYILSHGFLLTISNNICTKVTVNELWKNS